MTRKTAIFEGWSWFKFNNLGLALVTNLKFYTSMAKGLKLKVRKFWGLIPMFVEVTGEKLVQGEHFCPHFLNRVKTFQVDSVLKTSNFCKNGDCWIHRSSNSSIFFFICMKKKWKCISYWKHIFQKWYLKQGFWI